MALDGYIRGKPDIGWWEDQIKAGEEFRKKFAYEGEWDKWRSYYRGNWRGDVMPVNLFYTYMRTIVPRIYFRDPTVSISPGKPGLEHLAFARILERVDNKILRRMRFKQEMKRVVQDAFLLGTGIPKMGFGGFFSPTIIDDPDAPLASGSNIEYYRNVESFMPWVARTNPGNFVVPAGTDVFGKARWTAEKITRPLSDLQRDPRFENTAKLKPFTPDTRDLLAVGAIQRPVKMVKMWEVRDKATNQVFVFSPDHSGTDKTLFQEPDRFLSSYGGFNYFPLIFNEDDEAFWGLPDSKILEPHQLEINEIKTQIMKHRRLSLVKILAKKKSITAEEAAKLVSEDVAAVAWVEGQASLANTASFVNSTIPRELFVAADALMGDVRETIGFSRNQFGEFNPGSGDTTATEANIVKQATEIRVDERRDATADVVVDFVEMMHPLLFDNWGQEQIIDVVGPGGVPIWVKVGSDLLRRAQYSVKVDPDSSIPETRALREQRAMQLFGLLASNPLIDPVKLTQYLLHELRGPQFDDMMKMLPGMGVTPDRPISMQDFTGMLTQSVGQAQQQGLRAPSQSNGAG